MKNTFLSLALAAGMLTLSQAATLPFPDVAATKKAAQEQNKPALIIWHGSDWMPDSDRLCADWGSLPSLGMPVLLGQYDDCLGQEGNARNKMLPIECYNLPVALLLAPDGTLMGVFQPDTTKDAAKLAGAVQDLLPKLGEFVKLVGEARSSQGVPAATSAGKALDLVPMDSALRNRELINIINKQDEKDLSGYRALYGMDHLAMFKEINLLLAGEKGNRRSGQPGDFKAAEAYVQKALKQTKLQGERRQQWLAGLYYIQKEKALTQKTPNVKPMLATLRKIINLDPTSQTGIGADKYYKYWDPNTFYTIEDYYYDSGDQTFRFEKEWHVDVSSSMQGPGEYSFALIPSHNGAMVTRDFRLVINGKPVGQALGIDDQTNTKTVKFNVPDIPEGAKTEVWLRAQCNDGWLGCSGSIEMKKN